MTFYYESTAYRSTIKIITIQNNKILKPTKC